MLSGWRGGRGVLLPGGVVKAAGDIYQYQFASTVARLLGVEYKSPQPVGPAIDLNK
jgi:hypothetical protein